MVNPIFVWWRTFDVKLLTLPSLSNDHHADHVQDEDDEDDDEDGEDVSDGVEVDEACS